MGITPSRTTLHLAILIFLLYIISVWNICTQSPILICFFVFPPKEEERSFFLWLLWNKMGCSRPVNLIYQTSSCTPVQSFKIICLFGPPSSLLLFFYCCPFQWENELVLERIPQALHKYTVIYHRGSSGKHYPYIQKQASTWPKPSSCRLDVNVLNDENVYNFIINVFPKLFCVSQWQTYLENYWLIICTFLYKKKT